MQIAKKISSILLIVVIVLASILSLVTLSIRTTVLNPKFYSRILVHTSAYEPIYNEYISMLKKFADSQPGIPDEYRDNVDRIIENAVTEPEFEEMVGGLIGDGMGWLLYNHPEKDVPVRAVITAIREEIKADEEIMAVDLGEYTLEYVVDITLTGFLQEFDLPADSTVTYRDYVHYYMSGGSQRIKDNLDYYTDVYAHYFATLFNRYTMLSIIVLIVSLGLLFVLYRKNLSFPVKVSSIIAMIYGVLLTVSSIGFFVAVPIGARLVALPDSIGTYLPIAAKFMTQMGLIAILCGVLLVAISVGLQYARKIMIQKQEQKQA